jgi:hypothetical protein
MSEIKIKSAMVDVTKGQHLIAKKLNGRPTFGPCPEEFRVPVTLEGYIQHEWCDDEDGLQSFVMVVTKSSVTL